MVSPDLLSEEAHARSSQPIRFLHVSATTSVCTDRIRGATLGSSPRTEFADGGRGRESISAPNSQVPLLEIWLLSTFRGEEVTKEMKSV